MNDLDSSFTRFSAGKSTWHTLQTQTLQMELARTLEASLATLQILQFRTRSESERGEITEGAIVEMHLIERRTIFDGERGSHSLLRANLLVCRESAQEGKRLHGE